MTSAERIKFCLCIYLLICSFNHNYWAQLWHYLKMQEWQVLIYNIRGRNQAILLSHVISKPFYPEAEWLWNKTQNAVAGTNPKYSHCACWFVAGEPAQTGRAPPSEKLAAFYCSFFQCTSTSFSDVFLSRICCLLDFLLCHRAVLKYGLQQEVWCGQAKLQKVIFKSLLLLFSDSTVIYTDC